MTKAREFESLYALSYQMRKRFLEIFTRLGFGHVTTAFSATEILVTLYKEVLRYQADNPAWGGRDRFVLSKGHGAGMLFPIFEEIGYLSPEQTNDMICIGGDYEYIRSLFLPGYDFYGGFFPSSAAPSNTKTLFRSEHSALYFRVRRFGFLCGTRLSLQAQPQPFRSRERVRHPFSFMLSIRSKRKSAFGLCRFCPWRFLRSFWASV